MGTPQRPIKVIPEGAYTAFYRLSNVTGQISAYIFDVVRSTVPKIELDEVFLQKAEIGEASKMYTNS